MTLQWAHFHWLIWEHKRHKAGGQVSNSISPTPSILIVHFQCYPRLYRHTRLLSSLSVQVFIRRDNKSDCSSHRSEILQMFSSESDSPSIRTLSRDFSLPDNVNDGFGGLPFRFGPDSRQTPRIGFPIRFYIDDSFQWLFGERGRGRESANSQSAAQNPENSPVLVKLQRESVGEESSFR